MGWNFHRWFSIQKRLNWCTIDPFSLKLCTSQHSYPVPLKHPFSSKCEIDHNYLRSQAPLNVISQINGAEEMLWIIIIIIIIIIILSLLSISSWRTNTTTHWPGLDREVDLLEKRRSRWGETFLIMFVVLLVFEFHLIHTVSLFPIWMYVHLIIMAIHCMLTLKGPGFFVYLKSGGGRIPPPPPPSDLGRRATKILKFGMYIELFSTHMLTKLQYWKSKRFWIMQIYVNYVHVFLFLIITDKMRPFGAFKLFWYCRRNI